MPDQDKCDDGGTAAKRPTYHYYLDIRNDGKGVGPHTPARINWWLEHRMLSPEILARRIDQDKWTRLSEITRFSNFLDKIAKLPPPPPYKKEPWEDEPATEKQLKKLGSFDLPFPQTNLTKGEASRLSTSLSTSILNGKSSIKTNLPTKKNETSCVNSSNDCPVRSKRIMPLRRILQMRKPLS